MAAAIVVMARENESGVRSGHAATFARCALPG
jgi:hypothetical protein